MTATADVGGVRVRDLVHSYGDAGFRLELPSLDVPRGATLACIGPSGCGKTTLLHLLAGILLPSAGRVVLEGTDWAACSDRERRARRITDVGLVFQQFALLDHLSVRENILLPYFVHPALRLDDAAEQRVEELAEATGILAHLARRPRELSHGERQRTAICRALITSPRVVLADEPTGNLDPATTGRVLDMLLEQTSARGSTLVMVTHDHALVSRFDQLLDFADLRVATAAGASDGAGGSRP